MAATATPLESLNKALLSLGYHTGAPSAAVSEIDAEVARETACPDCGRKGRAYHAFTRAGRHGPRRYLAYAVCSNCAALEEI